MGCKLVPNYATIFMATIDKAIKNLFGSEAFSLLKRFLDDYFGIFNGSTQELHRLLDKINLINPSIQLTMNYTSIENEPREDRCDCPDQYSIPFLDVLCTIREGNIITDL